MSNNYILDSNEAYIVGCILIRQKEFESTKMLMDEVISRNGTTQRSFYNHFDKLKKNSDILQFPTKKNDREIPVYLSAKFLDSLMSCKVQLKNNVEISLYLYLRLIFKQEIPLNISDKEVIDFILNLPEIKRTFKKIKNDEIYFRSLILEKSLREILLFEAKDKFGIDDDILLSKIQSRIDTIIENQLRKVIVHNFDSDRSKYKELIVELKSYNKKIIKDNSFWERNKTGLTEILGLKLSILPKFADNEIKYLLLNIERAISSN